MIRGNMSGTKQKRVDIVFSTEHCVMLSKNGSWTDQIVFLGKMLCLLELFFHVARSSELRARYSEERPVPQNSGPAILRNGLLGPSLHHHDRSMSKEIACVFISEKRSFFYHVRFCLMQKRI